MLPYRGKSTELDLCLEDSERFRMLSAMIERTGYAYLSQQRGVAVEVCVTRVDSGVQ